MLSELIPFSWASHYYKDTDHPHNNPLCSIVSALLLQKLLSVPKVELLITFLTFSSELRDFCGLKNIPDASFFQDSSRIMLMTSKLSSINLLILLNPSARNLVKTFQKN